ncbi:type III secretion system inner membrane ring subunit SctD [Pleionea sp. CnH1-48]|uniref:type III secretion system inner membrane ring subunit SctD n=1 Tax=Pleionea sp. CnH1-48 TaxID=2954494 RepID=UPI002097729F|nr:type III secretion system inner membrane ring subunit SctD [Pleionea sp. CnH1-48]MCO7227018.1 type III secretion system inner membrane ring subunit SctD [Pleionea sp. CnH1-48]
MNEWVLKILSGPHIGAEVQLSEGSYTLGTDESNDIVLTDELLSGQHFKIDITSEGCTVVNLTQEPLWYLNGEPVNEDSTVVQPFDILTSKHFYIALGSANEQWPEMRLPSLNESKPEDDELSESDSTEADGEETEATANEQTETDQALTATEEDRVNNSEEKKRSKWPIVVVIVLLIGIVSIFLFSGDDTVETPTEPVISNEQKLATILDTLALPHVKFNLQPSGILQLTGYVDTRSQLDQLMAQCKEQNIQIFNRIKVIEKILAQINEQLVTFEHTTLSVKAAEQPGEFVITGYFPNSEQWEELENSLLSNVPAAKAFIAAFETPQSRLGILEQKLEAAGIKENVTTQLVNNNIQVVGQLPKDKFQLWKTIEKEFNDQYKGLPQLEFDDETLNLLNILGIKDISLGDRPYIITYSGQHISPGGKLQNGFTVDEISTEKLMLRRGNEQRVYYLGLDEQE